MATYACTVTLPGERFEALAALGKEALELRGTGSDKRRAPLSVLYADVMDLRLLNYHLRVVLRDGEVELSAMGYQTEEFFEKLWVAYNERARASLFVEGAPAMRSEGDYAYDESDGRRGSIAKLELYEDCLCIMPHDVGARRVPLCFADKPEREGFRLGVRLDTGERYSVARLGGDTEPFFTRLVTFREKTVAAWDAAHRSLERDLDERLGDALPAYQVFQSLDADVTCGLFGAEDNAFWFAAVGDGRAAVELVAGEKAATYLYRFEGSRPSFVATLRHAMEAVKTNRRLIFLSDEELAEVPLYRMAVDRSAHVRTLRGSNTGRVIHTQSWEGKLREFFGV